MKEFNTTAVCIPSKHYMVDITDKVNEIKKMVDEGKYFTINRARQYGKTTTLNALRKVLLSNYQVINLDFQSIGAAGFKTEQTFVQEFSRAVLKKINTGLIIPREIDAQLTDFISRKKEKAKLGELFNTLSSWCGIEDKGLVLMIDEVDSASNNQVFLDFLSQLRDGYISRETGKCRHLNLLFLPELQILNI